MTTPTFTLVQLRYFAAAVDAASITGAAETLRVSQSAVSAAITALEKQVGVQLLLRHRARGLTLTAAGTAFHRDLRAFLAHAMELQESARSVGTELVGQLVVGCFSTLAPFSLPTLLADLHRRHPAMTVSVAEGSHAQVKQDLRAGRSELALMYGYDLDDDFDRVTIDRATPYALVPPEHHLSRRKQVWLKELVEEPLVLLDLPHTADYFLALFTSVGEQPHVRFRSPGFETVRAYVAQGLGYAVLNQRPRDDSTYAGGRVVPLALRDELPALDIVLAWMGGTRLTRRAQEFITLTKRTSRPASGRSERAHHTTASTERRNR